MQKNIENGTTVLLADHGMMLTDGSSIVSVVRLGKEADGSGWYEITVEEAEEMKEEYFADAWGNWEEVSEQEYIENGGKLRIMMKGE